MNDNTIAASAESNLKKAYVSDLVNLLGSVTDELMLATKERERLADQRARTLKLLLEVLATVGIDRAMLETLAYALTTSRFRSCRTQASADVRAAGGSGRRPFTTRKQCVKECLRLQARAFGEYAAEDREVQLSMQLMAGVDADPAAIVLPTLEPYGDHFVVRIGGHSESPSPKTGFTCAGTR